jgi:hypothetical protein
VSLSLFLLPCRCVLTFFLGRHSIHLSDFVHPMRAPASLSTSRASRGDRMRHINMLSSPSLLRLIGSLQIKVTVYGCGIVCIHVQMVPLFCPTRGRTLMPAGSHYRLSVRYNPPSQEPLLVPLAVCHEP